MLDRQHHTTGAQLFAGTKALRMHACTALFHAGNPASLVQEKVWSRMLARGAASHDGLTQFKPKTWGGFHGIPLVTSERVQLNVQLGSSETKSRGVVRSPTVYLVVHAYIVPDKAMPTSVLLGGDGWSLFPTRTYRDLNSTETLVTFVGKYGGSVAGDHRFKSWISNAVGMIEEKSGSRVVVRVASSKCRLPLSWVRLALTKTDGTAAPAGSYSIRFGEGWFPQEAIIEAGVSEIPLKRLNADGFLVHTYIKNHSFVSGIRSGVFFVSALVCDSWKWNSRSNSLVRAPASGGGSNVPRPAVSVPHIDVNTDGCRARQARSCKNTACRRGIPEILVVS